MPKPTRATAWHRARRPGRERRLDVLQRTENEFDPIPFDVEAARIYGRVCAAVVAAGRRPRRRIADLMIASVAVAEGLPLYTTNPQDFVGLEDLLTVVPVTRPDAGPDAGVGAGAGGS
ncbi:PIN domain-containing protein [Spirillospora sp. NPDC047418]